MSYTVAIKGTNSAGLRFEQFPSLAHDRLVETITDMTEVLEAAVRAGAPHGRTGRLAASVRSGVEQSDTRVRGWVSLTGDANAVRKAAALEYGSTGEPFDVKTYTRTLDQVFGKLEEPFQQIVDAYKRAGGLEELQFLHTPFDASKQAAIDAMNAAVFGAAAGEK